MNEPFIEHLDDEDGGRGCWCKPDMILELGGREIWVHHGPGDELPPSQIIAAAVLDLILDKD